MNPLEIIKSPKSIGMLKAEKDFSVLPFEIDGKPIVMSIEGISTPEFQLSQFNNKKLQLTLDVSNNGELLFTATQLTKLLQEHLDDATLPEVTAIVKNFVKNEKVYVSWPNDRLGYKLVETEIGFVQPLDEEKWPKLCNLLKEKFEGGVVCDCELMVWVRREQDKSLVVGICPRLQKLKFLNK